MYNVKDFFINIDESACDEETRTKINVVEFFGLELFNLLLESNRQVLLIFVSTLRVVESFIIILTVRVTFNDLLFFYLNLLDNTIEFIRLLTESHALAYPSLLVDMNLVQIKPMMYGNTQAHHGLKYFTLHDLIIERLRIINTLVLVDQSFSVVFEFHLSVEQARRYHIINTVRWNTPVDHARYKCNCVQCTTIDRDALRSLLTSQQINVRILLATLSELLVKVRVINTVNSVHIVTVHRMLSVDGRKTLLTLCTILSVLL